MRWVEPEIYLLGETRLFPVHIEQMIRKMGFSGTWETDAVSGCEYLTEVAGRLCYKSFGAGVNLNVTKVREGNESYLANILQSKHGSVLEHVSTTVAFIDVSRIFTHEIVRHRAGTAFSQESMRYVRTDDISMWLPLSIGTKEKRAEETAFDLVNSIKRGYDELAEFFGLASLKDFSAKKILTSALRRFLPGGTATNIIVTANHRAWRHMIEVRTSVHAEEEIRLVMGMVARTFKTRYPNIYQDMEEMLLPFEEDPLQLPVYVFSNSKV